MRITATHPEALLRLSVKWITAALSAAFFLALSPPAEAQLTSKKNPPRGDISLTPGEMAWAKAPDLFPPGAEMTVLEGDPARPGPFTIRLKLPSGYLLPPHRHTAAERFTVISGMLLLGEGTSGDKGRTRALEAGSFSLMSANNYHYAYAEGTTVIQLHGRGPLQIIYYAPSKSHGPKP